MSDLSDLQAFHDDKSVDVAVRNRRVVDAMNRVCCIEFGQHEMGTGFLVGSNLVLTCYHVVEGHPRPGKWKVRFDFRTGADHTIVSTREFTVTAIVEHSLPSPGDNSRDRSANPGSDTLDYALLRLNADAGTDMVDGTADFPVFRGWIDPPSERSAFTEKDFLSIVQHPIGGPQRTFEHGESILCSNANGTRICHLTKTLRGSSGSPCFNRNWEWVAMHQAGSEAWGFNRAITAWTIAEDLRRKGIHLDPFNSPGRTLICEKPNFADFRGRGDPGSKGWKDEPLLITLGPVSFLVDNAAPINLRYRGSTIRIDQFSIGKMFKGSWRVSLTEAPTTFLGIIENIYPFVLTPGQVWSNELMFSPRHESSYLSWGKFVEFIFDCSDTTLRMDVIHEFERAKYEVTYHASIEILQTYLRLAQENGDLAFPSYVQPRIL